MQSATDRRVAHLWFLAIVVIAAGIASAATGSLSLALVVFGVAVACGCRIRK